MKFEADFHNFGQSVQKVGRGTETFFQKPRSIYWEWLFFGKNSPLSSFFKHSTLEAVTPSDTIFNLDIDMDDDFKGSSREVVASNLPGASREHLYSFGVLLGYCFAFGIRDLHRHNVVKTNSHLQVVDAEVVLSRLLLPHETLLLPFKEVGHDLCGAASILDLSKDVARDEIELVLQGYYDVFTCISLNHSDLLRTFEQRAQEFERIPIRHILRDTIHYRSLGASQPEIPFFASEAEQLGRGDIPYFFKFAGEAAVHVYTDRLNGYSPVALPPIFEKGAAREAMNPHELLDSKRIQTLMPTGLLYLGKTLIRSQEFSIENSNLLLTLSKEEVSVSLLGKTYRSRRS